MPRDEVTLWERGEYGWRTVAVRIARPDVRGASPGYPRAPLPDHVRGTVAWEWFRPSRRRIRRMDPAMRDHIDRGGVALRPITDAGRAALGLEPLREVRAGGGEAA